MALGEARIMTSKFRGCMIGSLLGDCLGAPFEGDDERVSKPVLQSYFDKLYGPYFNAPVKQYTDDTAMTKCVANSLLSNKGFDPEDMAKRFTNEYFEQPRRGYGRNVASVFTKLQKSNFVDVFAPAKEQFGGKGSLGNGGAMRVAPVALFYHEHKDGPQAMWDAARETTELTHANTVACNGAILQCMAVDQSLRLDPREPLDAYAFLDGLLTKLQAFEKDDDRSSLVDKKKPYSTALQMARKLLDKSKVFDEQVEDYLGTEIFAHRSVPTAIFCFLLAQMRSDLHGIKTEDPFRRTLQYAISVGGDTDTIASMAGALAGAYLGDKVEQSVLRHCEAADEMLQLGDRLLAASRLANI